MRYFTIEDLIKTENETILKSNEELPGYFVFSKQFIDLLFKLPHFTGKLEDINTSLGDFQSYGYYHLIDISYLYRCIYDLIEKGYYLEAIILIRHLYEIFIQLRYFHKYPEKLKDLSYIGQRIIFKNLFDEFSPEFYKGYYVKFFSSLSHGKRVKSIFRTEFDNERKSIKNINIGNKFNKFWATGLINSVIPIQFGVLNYYDKFFPNNILKAHDQFYQIKIDSLERLKETMSKTTEVNPDYSKFLQLVQGIIF